MNLRPLTAAALGAAALTLLPGSAKAQTATVDFIAAGSSAQFSTFTHAFFDQSYTNHYSTGSSSNFTIADPNAPNENAQVAVYWKTDGSGVYHVAAFYQVDSTVGVRAYFNSDTVTSPSTPPAAGNLGYPTSGDVTPPAAVLSALSGAAVTVGATDITPEDARVATQRSISLGYSTTNPIRSAVATTTANPVPFSLTAKQFNLVALGAVPVVVFINNGPTFAAIGTNQKNAPLASNLNINSFTLAGFLSGQFNRTSDLIFAAGAAGNPVHTYVREPLSGTYNTMEYTNPESIAKLAFTTGLQSGSIGVSGGQENGVSASANNPLNEPSTGSTVNFAAPANSGRIRAIGTGQLVRAVNSDTVDSLGYAFYSAGTFTINNASGQNIDTLRYLTVDGADPLQDSYTGGSIVTANVTYRNIINGGYPLWSILRVVTPKSLSTAAAGIINQAQGEDGGTDFASAKTLRVFRSYHQTPYTVGSVSSGNNGVAANGGDVGGAVFTINDDIDAYNDSGTDLSGLRQ